MSTGVWRNSLIEKKRATSISKYLSVVLRHDPAAARVTLDAEGWVGVDDLLAGAARNGSSFSRAELEEVVQQNEKQRFAFSLDGQRIRANQGHSVSVDLGLTPETPPELLYHGTVDHFLSSIMVRGLDKRSRQYVHLSPDVDTATRVGSRRGQAVILAIAASSMHSDGFRFFCSANGVWLTERVPPQYISRLVK
jgi:putative RNA 2'-phosphotransferase